MRKRSLATLALLTAAICAATACGSSEDSSQPTTNSVLGSPISVMIVGVKHNPVYSAPNLFDAARAATARINARGGLAGHELRLIECDSNLDPNQENACLKQAVDEQVSALVGSTLQFPDDDDVLQRAGIPTVGNAGYGPDDLKNPISWPFGGTISSFMGAVSMAKQDGLTSVAVASINTPATAQSRKLTEVAAKQAGLTFLGSVLTDVTQPVYDANASALIRLQPDGIIIEASAPQIPQFVKSLRSAEYRGRLYVPSASVDDATIEAMGTYADGVNVVATATPVSQTGDPMVKRFLDDMHTYAPTSKIDENAAIGWSGVETFYTLMRNQRAFAAKDVIAALRKLKKPVVGGLMGNFVGVGTSPVTSAPRAFVNHDFVPSVIRDGRIVPQRDGKFLDVFTSLGYT